MQVSVERVTNIERRLTIVVPADHIEAAYTKQIQRFAQKANIKGFRPGKAPITVIQQQFGDDARKEALGEVIQKALYEAISEQKLQPISTPEVEPKKLLPNEPFEFIASFEVLPEIEHIAFSLDSLEKITVDITEEDVDRVIEQLTKQFTKPADQDQPAEPVVLDEAFMKRLGIASGQLDDLKKQIRQSLTLERDRLVKEKLKEQIFNGLLEQNPIEVPKALVAREAKNIHDEAHPHHHDHHNHSHEELATYETVAKKRVALGLIIGEYAKKNALTADDARVMTRIEEIASVYEDPHNVVKWLSSEQQRGGIEAQVLEDQVIDKLMGTVPVKEKNMTYAELKGIRI